MVRLQELHILLSVRNVAVFKRYKILLDLHSFESSCTTFWEAQKVRLRKTSVTQIQEKLPARLEPCEVEIILFLVREASWMSSGLNLYERTLRLHLKVSLISFDIVCAMYFI